MSLESDDDEEELSEEVKTLMNYLSKNALNSRLLAKYVEGCFIEISLTPPPAASP